MMIHFQRHSKGMFRFIFSILFILAIPIILSSLLSCRISVEGDPHYQGSGPAHLSRIEGTWFLNFHNNPGKLEFYWTGSTWAGRFWDEGHRRWEELRDIFFNSHTGQLQFNRPHNNQQYSGTLSGNQILGTFSSGGFGSYPWEARRP